MSSDIYRYMNFDQIEAFQKSADDGKRIAAQVIDVVPA
jgi:aconitate hydratase 2/2-methylisocitrate dehydratase